VNRKKPKEKRVSRQYSAEGVEKAERRYCCSDHCLRRVAELTGVSLRLPKRRSGKNGWVEKKSEIGRALIEIRTNRVLLRKRLMEKCLESLDVREAVAVLSMESLAGKEEHAAGSGEPLAPVGLSRKGKDRKDAAAMLEEACRLGVNILAAYPCRIKSSTVKGLREAMALADEMKKGPHGQEPRKGLSDEAVEEIRRKILGIKPVS